MPGRFGGRRSFVGFSAVPTRTATRALRYALHSRFLQELNNVRQLVERSAAAQQVIQCQQRVRLAAAEGSLELNDWLTTVAANPLQRLKKKPANALGQIRPGEELYGVLIFDLRRAACDLRQVCRELGLPVSARGHVRMRPSDLSPRRKPLARNGRRTPVLAPFSVFSLFASSTSRAVVEGPSVP